MLCHPGECHGSVQMHTDPLILHVWLVQWFCIFINSVTLIFFLFVLYSFQNKEEVFCKWLNARGLICTENISHLPQFSFSYAVTECEWGYASMWKQSTMDIQYDIHIQMCIQCKVKSVHSIWCPHWCATPCMVLSTFWHS